MATKILLTLDHNDDRSWKKALPLALEQAKFYGAELHAVSVIPEIIQLPNLPANYGAGAKDHVRKAVQAILDNASASDVPVHIEEGSVYREILKLAHKEGFDMIVMASAKGDFPNYEIGPNLARVVRNAHCTVMVVRD
ncbi:MULTISPECIES: universal stress protein [unclassified Leisingera]|uniref:universal stress protein n=1 Tax=unclassified Leisingera TaxID=2614906 RepID=UPI001070BD79|nr:MULTISPECIES: universal stress protein [unclassified Leisingera]MBQ4823608.1 universal stress protein [Leisingera sp. HS039]MCF6430949.1 universal stress protein [Leisingera sp. MMG026]QBR37218.1 universal stress protein [Leisingera sp. NJS201]UWQ29431.1 universal stress protein [Leisingera sp. M523]UWQ74006.1 universal stress protein [Leisingera sp. M658]